MVRIILTQEEGSFKEMSSELRKMIAISIILKVVFILHYVNSQEFLFCIFLLEVSNLDNELSFLSAPSLLYTHTHPTLFLIIGGKAQRLREVVYLLTITQQI